MQKVENLAGVFFARKGHYNGKNVTITHRDPATGMLWLEDYVEKESNTAGVWVDADKVRVEW